MAPNAIEEQKTLEKSIEIDKVPESETEKLKAIEEFKLYERLIDSNEPSLKTTPSGIIFNDVKYEINSPTSESDREWAPPKKALSAYIFFSNTKRQEIVKANPDQPPNFIMTLIGKAWKSLTLDEKMPYIVMSEDDKKRYDRQKAEYDTDGKFYDDEGKRVKLRMRKKRSSSISRQSGKKKPRMSKD